VHKTLILIQIENIKLIQPLIVYYINLVQFLRNSTIHFVSKIYDQVKNAKLISIEKICEKLRLFLSSLDDVKTPSLAVITRQLFLYY